MTTLATQPVEEPDLLSLIADNWTTLAKPFADKFRDACQAEAQIHDGWVNPNRVRARLLNESDFNPRQYAALWSTACGRSGYLVKTDVLVPISGEGSRGNGGKKVLLRRWVGESA